VTGGGTTITATDSGTNTALAINAKGAGLIAIGNVSTGGVSLTAGTGGIGLILGSDATGDIYYRSSGGVLVRLPIGGGANVLTVSGGLPAWVAPPGGGNVSNSGTPTAGQFAQWVNSTQVAGFSPAPITASLGSNVALNSSTYTDGPSIAQGTTGTWWVSGTITGNNTAGASFITCKLWDGTTVISSTENTVTAANLITSLTLSGFLATPAGNLRISCISQSSASSNMLFNSSGTSKDSTITAHRIQ
jgi:hypothetical protein